MLWNLLLVSSPAAEAIWQPGVFVNEPHGWMALMCGAVGAASHRSHLGHACQQ